MERRHQRRARTADMRAFAGATAAPSARESIAQRTMTSSIREPAGAHPLRRHGRRGPPQRGSTSASSHSRPEAPAASPAMHIYAAAPFTNQGKSQGPLSGALETSAPGHFGSRPGRSAASTASTSVVRYRSTPQGVMPTRWPLCTAMGNAVEGEQVIASVVKHSCGSSARRRSFHAAIRWRAISRESRPPRHIDACVISRMDVGGDYGCGRGITDAGGVGGWDYR